jgi:hypothetical protein
MANLLWYICLAVISIGSAAYAIYKKRDTHKSSTLLVFYLFAAGFAWIGEFTVLGLFNAYAYKTGVFESPWAQNLLGHLILNTTLYPTAAVVMVAYSLRYGYIALVSASFTLIEFVFVNLKLYEQHWWRYYMTAIIVIGILLIDKKVFTRMKQRCSGIKRSAIFYFVAMIIIHTPAPVLLLLGKQYYQISLINSLTGDLYLTSIIIIFFYHLIEAFLLVLFTCILKKWYWKVLPFIISIVVQSIFLKMGILVLQEGWKFIYMLIIYQIFIAAFIFIEKHTVK